MCLTRPPGSPCRRQAVAVGTLAAAGSGHSRWEGAALEGIHPEDIVGIHPGGTVGIPAGGIPEEDSL